MKFHQNVLKTLDKIQYRGYNTKNAKVQKFLQCRFLSKNEIKCCKNFYEVLLYIYESNTFK